MNDVVELTSLHQQLCDKSSTSHEDVIIPKLRSYCKLVSDIPLNLREQMFDFLSHPFFVHLNDSGDTACSVCLDGFSTLVTEFKMSGVSLCRVADAMAQTLQMKKKPEEIPLKVVRVVLLLLTGLHEVDWGVLANRALFGFLLSQLLECSVMQKMRELRLASLRASVALFTKFDKETAAAFFPGYLSTLQRICCGDFKQGVDITVLALHSMCASVLLFFEDAQRTRDLEELHSLVIATEKEAAKPASPQAQKEERVDHASFHVELTEEWMKESGKKVEQALDKAFRYLHSTYAEQQDENRVREALSICCGKLLSQCPTVCNVRVMCDMLVLYSNDDWPNVSAGAQMVLEDNRKIVEAKVRAAFHEVVVALPRIIRKSTEAEKLTKLKLTCGYAQLLGPSGLPSTLVTSVSSVVEAVAQILAIDRNWGSSVSTTKVSVLYEMKEPTESGSAPQLLSVPVSLTFCSSKSLKKWALTIPKDLACDAKSAVFFFDYLMQQIDACCASQNCESLAEYILITSQMYLGVELVDQQSLERLTKRLLLSLLNDLNLNDVQDLMGLALTSYLINSVAWKMQKAFDPFVAPCLPLVLKCLGNEDYHVSSFAWTALCQMTKSMGSFSVHELIRSNADYIIDDVVKDLRLSRSQKKARIPYVVSGILRYSPTNATWLLDDVLQEVLRTLDASSKSSKDLTIFTKILEEISVALLNVLSEEQQGGISKQQQDIENSAEEEQEPKPTQSQVIATKIIDRVRNFIASKELSVQLQSLSCVTRCLEVLRSNRRELLPAVYAVWDPLMRRLESRSCSPVVICKTADSLAEIARLATDFLSGEKYERMFTSYSRIMDEFLKEHSKSSISSSSDLFAATTLSFKAIRSVLGSLLSFCKYVPLSSEKQVTLKCSLARFEDKHIHQALAQIAAECLSELDRHNKP